MRLLYAVIRDPLPPSIRASMRGVDGSEVYQIGGAGAPLALASSWSGGRLPGGTDALTLAAHVAAEASEHTATLPMRYGSTCPDDASLVAWLEASAPTLLQGLERVRGRVELAVRVIESSDESAMETPTKRPGAAVAATGSGRHYLARRLEVLRHEGERTARARGLAERMRAALADLHADVRCEPARASDWLLTASFLVPRASISEAADRIAEAAESSGHAATVTGPWPPYSFTPAEVSP